MITPRDRAWVAEHHPAPALLLRIHPRHGLRDRDFATLTRWAGHQPSRALTGSGEGRPTGHQSWSPWRSS